MKRRLLLFALVVMAMLVGVSGTASASHNDCNTLDEYGDTEEYRQCLAEHTTKAELQEFIDTNPEELTQKQIDAVYAASPERWDDFGFTDEQKRKTTDWMGWEMFDIEPDWAHSTDAPTKDCDLLAVTGHPPQLSSVLKEDNDDGTGPRPTSRARTRRSKVLRAGT